MSRSEYLGKSSGVSPKQSVKKPISLNGDDCTPDDIWGGKKGSEKVCSSLPARLQACSEHVCQETGKSEEGLSAEALSPKEFTSISPRTCAGAQSRALPDEELKMKELKNLEPPDSTVTGATAHAVEPVPEHGAVGDKGHIEEEVAEDEELKAPLHLIRKVSANEVQLALALEFQLFKARKVEDFELARKLCEAILIFKPKHPEASRLLPQIWMKLLEAQELEQRHEGHIYDKDSESGEKTSCTSSCFSSSSDDELEVVLEPGAIGDKGPTEEEDDEDFKAPVGLIRKLIRALKDEDFEVAYKLCETILIYEPEHPEASELLPLIQVMLQGREMRKMMRKMVWKMVMRLMIKTPKVMEGHHIAQTYSFSSSDDDGEDNGDEKQVNRKAMPSFLHIPIKP